jgi:enediyne core biosynthesis thioesterase
MNVVPLMGAQPPRLRAWTWRPFIGFQDTNLVGNVYFAHYVSWQGRCREAFLAEHAPDVLNELAGDLRLVTMGVTCDFYEELTAFDQLAIEMRLSRRDGHRLTLDFNYWLDRDGSARLAAHGTQQVACMRLMGQSLVPAELPPSLDAALATYASPTS